MRQILASMGPRSVERGINGSTALITIPKELQWGRAPWSAESGYEPSLDTRDSSASMGPRSVERGIKLHRGDKVRRIRASMGPRSVERGITEWTRYTERNKKLQWGRAPWSAESFQLEGGQFLE